MLSVFLLFIFGGLGTLARYSISQVAVSCCGTAYPWGTFAVNLLGCFLFGIGFGLFQHNVLPPQWKLLLLTGFLGGLTTFSAFAHENVVLFEQGHYGSFVLHFAGQTVLGLAAVLAGAVSVNR